TRTGRSIHFCLRDLMTPTQSQIIALTRGVPDPEVLPAKQLAECFSAILTADPVGTLQYGHFAGYTPLRKLLAGQYGVAEEEVFVSNGSLQLMDFLASHFVRFGNAPQDTVLVEQPSYDRAIGAFRRRGAKVIGIPLENDGLDLGRLEAQLRRASPRFIYLIPDFQNPSGITLSIEKRRRLLQLADEHAFWIVEDVPYRRLRYQGDLMPTLREVSLETGAGRTRVITMTSYSKLVAPAMRVGHLVAPKEVVTALAKLGEDTYLTPALPTQAALYEFLRRDLLDANIELLKTKYGPRCQAMIDAVCEFMPDVGFARPEGGFFLSLTLPETANTANLLERARQKNLLLTDGRAFFADADDPSDPPPAGRFIRLPFCAIDELQIREGIKRLADVVR
ncbi:MAG TPA: PLP-dependent aminotransferase family protein, partial [Chloroflexota bacterium]|nr:PLP-dependent aminotransferase family protein [Chloroflexota bacterium]